MNKNNFGQASIENLILLAIGLFILVLLTSVAWEQVTLQYTNQQTKMGFVAVNNLAKEIDDVYFLGPGSKKEVLVTFPDLVDFNSSSIENKTLLLNVGNNNVFATTKAQIKGDWPNSNGSYLFTIEAFADFVSISVNTLSFSPVQINKTINQDSISSQTLSVTNLGPAKNYEFLINFSSAFATINSSDVGTLSFSNGETKSIDLNFSCANNSSGNYLGTLIFQGDINVSYPITLTCLSGQKKLTIYPSSKNINSTKDISSSKSFLICNNSSSNFENVSLSLDGNIIQQTFVDKNISIQANTCESIDLNINPKTIGFFNGKLIVNYASLETLSNLNLMIFPNINYYFSSINNNDLNHNFNFNGFVYQRSNDSFWTPKGELDWNALAIADNNAWKDQNLIAYYKFNKSSGTTVYDSAGNNNGILENGANINEQGMWDSNSLFCNDSSSHQVYIGDNENIFDGMGTLTICTWAKFNSKSNYDYLISKTDTSTFSDGSYGFILDDSTNKKIQFVIDNPADGSNSISIANEPSELNVWHHFCGRYDGNEVALFVNGVKQSVTDTASGNIRDTSSDLFLCNNGIGNLYFDGQIDELKIYDRNLSDQEIITDYNSFLEAKFASSTIFGDGQTKDWNALMINSGLANFSGNRARMQIDLNAWVCSDENCNNKVDSNYISAIDNNVWNYIGLNGKYFGYELFFVPTIGADGNKAGYFYENPFLLDVNISYSS